MKFLDWPGWDRLENLDRKVLRLNPRDPERLRKAAKWWPWSIILLATALAGALILRVVGVSIPGNFLLPMSALLGLLALQSWAASHPKRRS